MREEKNEFLGLLCNLYLVSLLVALPLYTGEGYGQLGDIKYTLFRNLSALCLGGWLLAGMPERIRTAAEYVRTWRARRSGAAVGWTRMKCSMFSRMDCAMIIYGACVTLSAVCSSYGKLAWSGYNGWYMGAVSQFLLVGTYFFVSRQYKGEVWPIYLGEAAFFLVTLLGLLHRLGIDPLGLMAGWNSRDWEYSHLLSTLGNINWLCGYYSVALAFVVVHFFQAERLWTGALLYLASVSAFVLLCIQGSQSGLLILAVCVAVCFFFRRRQKAVWRKITLILAGTFFAMPLMEVLMKLRGDKAAIVADGNIYSRTSWYGWLLAAVICLLLFFLMDRGEVGFTCFVKRVSAAGRWKAFKLVLLAFLGTGTILAALLFIRNMDDSFGSGRGFLWRIAVESFLQADGKDKLLGAGPDCYGEAVFNRLGAGTDVWEGEHWEGAVFTNAHNEFLSQLCNVGILGTISYLSIFLVGLCRYGGIAKANHEAPELVERERALNGSGNIAGEDSVFHGFRNDIDQGRMIPGVCESGVGLLALAMYGIHSLVSFQQVLNAPLLFLVLGLCEAERRREQREQLKNKKAA